MTPKEDQIITTQLAFPPMTGGRTLGAVVLRIRQPHQRVPLRWLRFLHHTHEEMYWISATSQKEAVQLALLRIFDTCPSWNTVTTVVRTEGW